MVVLDGVRSGEVNGCDEVCLQSPMVVTSDSLGCERVGSLVASGSIQRGREARRFLVK